MSITIYRYASSVKARKTLRQLMVGVGAAHELSLDFGVVVGFFVAMAALATRAYSEASL